MKTPELREVLSVVAPSLSTKDFVPAFRNLFFDGERVSAFNGKFGISMTCHSECVGAVRGEVLVGFMSHARGKRTTLEVQDGALSVVSGRSHLDLPFTEQAVSPLHPLVNGLGVTTAMTLDQEMLEGLKLCVARTIDDPTLGARMGILFDVEAKGVRLYATDSKTLSSFTVKRKTGVNKRVCFSVSCDFVTQLLRLATKFKGERIAVQIGTSVVLVTFGEDCLLAGSVREVESSVIQSFVTAIDQHSAKVSADPLPVPPSFLLALDRALAVAEPQTPLVTECRVEQEFLHFHTATRLGEVVDRVKFPQELPAQEFKMEIELVKRMATSEMDLQITKSYCLIFTLGSFRHFIGTQPVSRELSSSALPAEKRPQSKARVIV